MFLMTVTIVLLTVLYALAWHNQPAREPVAVRHPNRKAESHE